MKFQWLSPVGLFIFFFFFFVIKEMSTMQVCQEVCLYGAKLKLLALGSLNREGVFSPVFQTFQPIGLGSTEKSGQHFCN